MTEFSREKPIKLSLEVNKFRETMQGLGVKRSPKTGNLEVDTSPKAVGRIQKEVRKKLESLSPEDRECFQAQICGAFTEAVGSLNKKPKIDEPKLLGELRNIGSLLTTIGIFAAVPVLMAGIKGNPQFLEMAGKFFFGGAIPGYGGTGIILSTEVERKERRKKLLESDYKRVITKQLVPNINNAFKDVDLNLRIIPDTTEEELNYILLHTQEVPLGGKGGKIVYR